MKHAFIEHGIRRSYWCGNEAADMEDATRVRLAPIGKHWPEFTFELPAQQHEFEKVQHLIMAAARSGDHNARAEIRKALGL